MHEVEGSRHVGVAVVTEEVMLPRWGGGGEGRREGRGGWRHTTSQQPQLTGGQLHVVFKLVDDNETTEQSGNADTVCTANTIPAGMSVKQSHHSHVRITEVCSGHMTVTRLSHGNHTMCPVPFCGCTLLRPASLSRPIPTHEPC